MLQIIDFIVNKFFYRIIASSLILVSVVFPFELASQSQIRFERVSERVQLSISVRGMVQDDQGFIWVASNQGLFRYDGYEFTPLENVHSVPLTSSSLRDILIDSTGLIWVAMQGGGLECLDLRNDTSEKFLNRVNDTTSLVQNGAWSMCMDSYGGLWVGTFYKGVNRLNIKDKKFKRYAFGVEDGKGVPEGTIMDMLEDINGDIWLAMDYGGLVRFKREDQKFEYFKNGNTKESLPDDDISALYLDSKGTLWLGTINGKLVRFNREEENFESFDLPIGYEDELVDHEVYTINEVNQGELWIGTHAGLVIFHISTGKTQIHQYQNENMHSLKNNRVSVIFKDKQGNIWIGNEEGGGLHRLIKKNNFKYFQFKKGESASISNNLIRATYEDKSGNIWVGTIGGGMNKLEPGKSTFVRYLDDSNDTNDIGYRDVSAFLEDAQGNFWIGTWGDGVRLMNRETGKFSPFRHNPENDNSISNNLIQSIYQDKTGVIWVATETGLNTFDHERNIWKRYFHDEMDSTSLLANNVQPNAILEDSKGRLWFGTWEGLSLFNRSTDNFINWDFQDSGIMGLNINHIGAIIEDINTGNFWLGTYGGGLIEFSPDEGILSKFTTKEGLSSNEILSMESDNKGNLWIATSNGLSKFERISRTFRVFEEKNGLPTNEFYWGQTTKASNGNLLLCTTNGFLQFNPDSIYVETTSPKIVFTEFYKYGILQNISNGFENGDTIKLSYKDKIFSLKFTALNFETPGLNKFEYKLTNYHNRWVYLENKREIDFTNLDGGVYELRVRDSNAAKDNNYTRLVIVIEPPFWETWWFKWFGGLVAFVFVAIVYKVRSEVILSRERALERQVKAQTAKVEMQKNEILLQKAELQERQGELQKVISKLEAKNRDLENFSSIVSHDLKAPLASIIYLIDEVVLKENEEKLSNEVKEVIGLMQDQIKRMQKLIMDILSYTRADRMVKNEEFIVGDILSEILETLKIPDGITIEVDGLDIRCEGQKVKFHQIFANLISNAAKYHDKEEGVISVKIQDKGNEYLVSVSDDGPGIAPEFHERIFEMFGTANKKYRSDSSGMGLAIVKKIVEGTGGTIEVESSPGKGTTFRFNIIKHFV